MARRHYTNVAPPIALTSSVDDSETSWSVASTAGYPSAPFTMGAERGTVNEEVVLVTALTSTTLTVERGYDGTDPVAHNSSAALEHCVAALDYDEANEHINDTTKDHHTQYLNVARHDITARHAFGAALGTPAAAVDIGTAADPGNGDVPARWNHVHKIGAGAINNANMIASGVVTRSALASTLLPVIQCTSGTRPSAPAEGQFIFETDTDRFKYWTGAAWTDAYKLDGRSVGEAGAGHTITSINNYQTIATATITNPGRAVQVLVWGSLMQIAGLSGGNGEFRGIIGISFDNGSTYTNSMENRFWLSTGWPTAGTENAIQGVSPIGQKSGTPTGNIKIRIQHYQGAGFLSFGSCLGYLMYDIFYI